MILRRTGQRDGIRKYHRARRLKELHSFSQNEANHSAIKFLLSQYRSIYKKAFVKGLITSIAFTTSLAAMPTVQAEISGGSGSWAEAADGTSTATSTINSSTTNKYFNNLNVDTGTLTIDGSTSGNPVFIKNTLTIKTGATLAVNGGSVLSWNSGSSGADTATGSLVNNGTLNVSGGATWTEFKDVTLKGTTNITGADGAHATDSEVSDGENDWDYNAMIVGGNNGGKVTVASGATVNLNDFSQLVVVAGSSMEVDGAVNFDASSGTGSSAFLRAADNYTSDKGFDAAKSAGVITLSSNATLTVESGDGTAGIFSAKTNIEGDNDKATITVGSGGKFTFNGDFLQKTQTVAGAGNGASLITMSSGQIKVASGGALTIGSGSFDSKYTTPSDLASLTTMQVQGGTLDIAGTVNVYGILNVGDDATLKASHADGEIIVSGSSAHTAELGVSAQNLSNFIKGTSKGGVLISGSGSLNFTDTSKVDLAQFIIKSGTAANTNELRVSGGSINAKYLAISEVKSGNELGQATLNSDTLELGSANYTTGDISFGTANVSKELIITTKNANDVSLALKGNVNLAAYTESKDENGNSIYSGTSGQISGKDLTISGKTLEVKAGNWTAEQTLTLENVDPTKLLITADATKKLDSTLVLNKGLDFNFNTAGGTAVVKVTGTANREYNSATDQLALLDLTKGITASGSNGSGTITATSGGIIKLNGENLTDLLEHAGSSDAYTKVALSAESGGKLDVEGDFELNYTEDNYQEIQSMIQVNAGGILDISDAFDVTLKVGDGLAEGQGAKLGFGITGTIRANSLSFSNNTFKEDGKTKTEAAYISRGIFEIASSLSSTNSKLVLGNVDAAAGAKGLQLYLATTTPSGTGTISVDNLELVHGANTDKNTVFIEQGNWSATNTNFILTSGSMDIGKVDGGSVVSSASLDAKGLKVAAGTLNVNTNSSASFDTLDLTGAAAGNVNINGSVVFDGIAKDETTAPTSGIEFGETDKVLKVNANASLTFGENATYNAIYASKTDGDSAGVTLHEGFKTIDLNGGQVMLSFRSGDTFSVEQLQDLKLDLFGSKEINGVLNIGYAGIGNLEFEEGTEVPTITWDNLKPVTEISSSVTSETLKVAVVTGVDSSAAFQGHVGSIQAADGSTSISIANNTSLNAAQNNNGFFASNADGTAAVELKVAAGYNLTLNNTGSSTGSAGNIKLGDANSNGQASTFTTSGSAPIALGKVTGGTGAQVNFMTDTSAESVEVENVDVLKSLTTAEVETTNFVSQQGTTTNATKQFVVEGSFLAGGNVNTETLSLSGSFGEGSFVVNQNAAVNVKTLITKANNSNVLQIGQDSVAADEANGIAGRESSTGYLFVESASLNGATIFADPDYDDGTSLVTVQKFNTPANNDVGTIDGNVVVGKNAAVGLGTNETGLREAIASYQNNGSLDAAKYGSILYLAESATLADGQHIVLNSSDSASGLTKTEEARDYKEGDVTGKADLAFSKNTAMLVNMNAFSDKEGQSTAALHFDKNTAVVYSNGGEIVLTGDYDAKSALDIFTDKGTGTRAAGDADTTGVKLVGQKIIVRSQNGLMVGKIEVGNNVGRSVVMRVDTDNIDSILTGASFPVRETIVAYGNGYKGDTKTEESELHSGIFDKNKVEQPIFNEVLNEALSNGDGVTAEQVSRLGIYGGSVQAAIGAGATSYEAVSGRMGVGAQTGSITFADNAQGAGLWVSPIYKSHDSDGFDVQGLSYGTDLSMYGLALGGDFTMANGLRVGAAFNLGSGDADGQGAGAGVSNDFDYYGFTVYGGFTMDKLSVVADVSYTVVDNDVSVNTDLGNMASSFDSTNLSVGVTGQYALNMGSVDVTPHAGLRYSCIDLDDYVIKNETEQAKYNGDSMGIFSVPVGVTFSKNIVAGSWNVKPAFDLTLSANLGDDSIGGSVDWAGVANLETNIESEVVDTFTYGATLGVSAQSGNMSLGFGVNYTGASNADEYGVQANARFVF